MKLRDLAERLACRLEGDGEIDIHRVAGLDQAGPGDVTFLANPRYGPALAGTAASAVILGEDAPPAPCAMLRTAHPYLVFARAMALFAPEDRPARGVHPWASVAEDARIPEDAAIGAFVSIGAGTRLGRGAIVHPHVYIGPNVTVGDDCVLHAHVSVREGTILGHRVIVQNGAVIGSDGFGFAPRPDGSYEKIPQVSHVVIEDDVEIGANTAVDRPALGETRVRAGTKIDNLVQVAHGVTIGRHTVLSAQVGVAGSSRIGDHVILAGQVGVADHLTVGDRVRATAQTGIAGSVDTDAFVSGTPAIDNREWRKSSVIFRGLPEQRPPQLDLQQQMAALEARIRELEAEREPTG